MNVIIYLLPMALGLGLLGLFGFLWALRSGQYTDVEGAALRVLNDDDVSYPSPERGGSREARGGVVPPR